MNKAILLLTLTLLNSTTVFATYLPEKKKAPGLAEQVVQQIDEKVVTGLKLGTVTTACDKIPEKPKDKESVMCALTTKDGKKAQIKVTFNVPDPQHVGLSFLALNVLGQEGLVTLINKALPELSSQAKEKVAAKDLDCGTYFIYESQADMLIPCVLTTPSNTKKRKVELHMTPTSLNVTLEKD